MKIICTKDELALLVRLCAMAEFENACRGCVFECICTKGTEELFDGALMDRIDNVCEIGDETDG